MLLYLNVFFLQLFKKYLRKKFIQSRKRDMENK
jgi:hypothetical protein